MLGEVCCCIAVIDVDAIAAKYARRLTLTEKSAKVRCNECGGLAGSVLLRIGLGVRHHAIGTRSGLI